MPRGGRKRRLTFCIPSCFSAPSVWDPDELEYPQDGLPLTYLTRLRSLSRTVPVVQIAGGGGGGHSEDLGEIKSEEAPALLSPAGNQDMELVQKFHKEEKKKIKSTVQSLPHAPLSARAHNQQSIFCHVSTTRSQPLPQLHHAHDPVQTVFRAIPFTLQPNQPAGLAPSLTRASRRLHPVTGLLMLSATLTVMLFFGRLFAVLCNCAWFYLLSCIPPPLPPAPAETEIDGAAEVDLDSPEYKKKVVLMGLLERNRYGVSGMPMTPMASPATARLRQPW